MKRIDYIGVTFRTRSTEEIREINRRMRADLLPAVESGELACQHRQGLSVRGSRRRLRAHARQRAFR